MNLKILHLASFSGNIGDIANHESFYYQFRQRINAEAEITQVEIRDFYKSVDIKSFDDDFVQEVNQHDLFIIGGGNFFELCWDYSDNGTTFNISNDRLCQITTPILINGIGIDDNKGIKKDNILKFSVFLDTLFQYNNVFFSVRNDGSFEIFKKYFPQYIHKIIEIPDFGFFIHEHPYIDNYQRSNKTRTLGINIALDMPQIRFSGLQYDIFLNEIAVQVDKILSKTDYNIFLFAHIISDYRAILDLVDKLTYKRYRTRISISPLIQKHELETFAYYKECDFIFATRFHSNVCAISMGIPTFGMVSYPKHEIVYEKLNLKYRKCNLNSQDFIRKLREEVEYILTDSGYIERIKADYGLVNARLEEQKEILFLKLLKWMDSLM